MDTILVSKQQKQRLLINSQHPLFYFKTRNYFLDNLAQGIQTNARIGQFDLRRNAHVDHLTKIYDKKKIQYQRNEKQKLKFLHPQQFQTIFDIKKQSLQERRMRQQQRIQRERNSMFNNFIQNYRQQEVEQLGQVQIMNIGSQKHKMKLQDLKIIEKREEDIKLLNREMNKLRMEIQQDNKKLKKKGNCNNIALIQKMSSSILSSYMAYFDEIFNQFIDQILEEQVYYLNQLQNEYDTPIQNVSKNIRNSKQQKLVQVLKQLDQLCDQDS